MPGENFKVVTYTGNGGTQAITGVGFKPDFVWCKRRNEGSDHNLTDSTRGIKTGLNINSNAQEGNQDPLGVTVFGDDGFTVSDNDGGGASVNGTNDTYVAWCWKAAGGATSNSDGSTTSTVNANKAAGFSIVTYTGTGSNASVGHGLGAPAKFIMIKKRSGASDWTAFTAIDNTKYLEPNGTPPFRTSNVWQNTDPTSSVFTLTTGGDSNGGSATYVAYCFADVEGYQKFGSYDGNGSTNGPVVNVGFEPAYVMVKNVDSTDNWLILDNKRNTANPRNNLLQMNLSNAESTEVGAQMNFYSNGFQSVGTGGGAGSGQINSNGDKYLYWAIAATAAETPVLASSFNIETYIGTGSSQSITGLGFQPNFVWLKSRSFSDNHYLQDSVRGATRRIHSNLTVAEQSPDATRFTSLDSDGFTLGGDASVNGNNETFVGWGWKAGDLEPTINTNGSLTSFVSANDNAGFSIVSYTGDGNSARTVGHGLSAKCDLVIIKGRDSADKWPVQLPQIGDNARMVLEGTAGKTDDSTTAQAGNATVFGIGGDNAVNKSGDRFIAYCFRNVTGYQKIGTFTGDGNNDRTITTGFKPDFVLIKSTVGNDNWRLYDTRRGVDEGGYLEPNRTDGDDTSNAPNLLMTSSGFTITSGGVSAGNNANGNLYFYWAIAKNVPSNTTLANSFKTVTYTGNGGTQSITGVGFKPDLVWMKQRSGTQDQMWYDNNRGAGHYISSNNANAQGYANSTVTSFDSDGFSVGSSNSENQNSQTFVAWCWKAGNTWESNINGTQPSLVNANTANGFSIVKWKTNGSSSQTVGHGLSSTPELVIYKRLDSAQDWFVETNAIDGSYDYANLNTDAAFTLNESGAWSTRATSTTITNFTSNNNFQYVAYCFHSVSGYSKIGTYTGTGSSGNAQNIGFQPDFVMIKAVDFQYNWNIYDGQRPSDSLTGKNMLIANANDTEYTSSAVDIDFTSTGFSFPNGYDGTNKSNQKFIYMAFKAN